ncbi:MAG: M2 family metallopeptidase, partial [Pseudomonadota bacterium]
AEAEAYVAKVNKDATVIARKRARAEWVKATYITDDTEALAAAATEEVLKFNSDVVEGTKQFNHLNLTGDTGRAMSLLKLGSSFPAPKDVEKRTELAKIAARLDSTYSKGQYCPRGAGSCKTRNQLALDLARSRDYDDLLEAWQGWRTVSPVMRADYIRLMALINEGAQELGFRDAGELWRAGYDMSPTEFESEAQRLWDQVKPLYEELHCYVRDRLSDQYGTDRVPPTEPIPAHLLGNMWAQSWTNIYDLVEPYPGVADLDITGALRQQRYDAVKMTQVAEGFFTSLGLPELPDSFWAYSMLTEPGDRDVDCHASAWPMDGKTDVRIKMCIRLNEEDFATIHHELGHIYYFLAQQNVPPVFQGGAHDGFHEAIGDTITLAMTPEYLQTLGLINNFERDERATINAQMKMALDKIAFLPFGKLVDQWRWQVFSGETSSEELNQDWWELRTNFQGIRPAIERTEKNFDAGAKYHVPANVPYTRYFLSNILQFQFYKAMCGLAEHQGPLNECSFHGSKTAGNALNEMLALGRSQPWPDALERLTGTRQMDATPIIDYFAPLMGWLQKQNQDSQCGW